MTLSVQTISSLTQRTPSYSRVERPRQFLASDVTNEQISVQNTPKSLPITINSLEKLPQIPLESVQFKLPSDKNLSDSDKKVIIQRLIEVNLLAIGHKGIHTLRSGINNANIAEMDNGFVGKGVNTEGHVELSVCAERAAIANAVSQSSDRHIQETLRTNANPNIRTPLPKVIRTFQAGDRLQPCSECLPWMQSQIFYTPDTESYFLKRSNSKDPAKEWTVECRRVKDMLPIHQTMKAPYTHKSLSMSPITLSSRAKEQLGQKKLAEKDLVKLLAIAKEMYLSVGSNPLLTPRTLRNIAASVLLSDGTMAAAPYIEIRRFSQSSPDFAAFNSALQQSPYFKTHTAGENISLPRINAIAYYGSNADFPAASQLNSFSHRNWGGPETLIVTPSDAGIQVRTIADYLPFNFNEDKSKPSTNGQLNAFA